jgi:hypothetical protein
LRGTYFLTEVGLSGLPTKNESSDMAPLYSNHIPMFSYKVFPFKNEFFHNFNLVGISSMYLLGQPLSLPHTLSLLSFCIQMKIN